METETWVAVYRERMRIVDVTDYTYSIWPNEFEPHPEMKLAFLPGRNRIRDYVRRNHFVGYKWYLGQPGEDSATIIWSAQEFFNAENLAVLCTHVKVGELAIVGAGLLGIFNCGWGGACVCIHASRVPAKEKEEEDSPILA